MGGDVSFALALPTCFLSRVAKDPDAKVVETPLTPAELKEFREREEKLKAFIADMRLQLAKLNREVLRYTTAVDEIPGTAELLQYEKRFIELYNQGMYTLVTDTITLHEMN